MRTPRINPSATALRARRFSASEMPDILRSILASPFVWAYRRGVESRCPSCPHQEHWGECPGRVIDLTHAPADRPCWCSTRAGAEKEEPVKPEVPTSR